VFQTCTFLFCATPSKIFSNTRMRPSEETLRHRGRNSILAGSRVRPRNGSQSRRRFDRSADKVSGTDFGHIGRKKPFSVPDTFSVPFCSGGGRRRRARRRAVRIRPRVQGGGPPSSHLE
jgi:hypothetical protein